MKSSTTALHRQSLDSVTGLAHHLTFEGPKARILKRYLSSPPLYGEFLKRSGPKFNLVKSTPNAESSIRRRSCSIFSDFGAIRS